MAECHLVSDLARLPTPTDWISRMLGIDVTAPESVDVLFFERFGEELSSVVLLPRHMESLLPMANRVIERTQVAGRIPGAAYSPPKRVARAAIPGDQHSLGIEHIACDEVSLRLSTARVSSWGINLDLLKREEGMDTSYESFVRWLALNGLPAQGLSPQAGSILHAAFAVAMAEKLDTTKSFRAPRLPVIHNQRCGLRYRLYFGREKQGSPCDIHVLLYEDGARKPTLYGVPANERPTATERKEGLTLLQTWDRRIRYYQLTDDQWAEWSGNRPDISGLAPELRGLVERAFAAAEEMRQLR